MNGLGKIRMLTPSKLRVLGIILRTDSHMHTAAIARTASERNALCLNKCHNLFNKITCAISPQQRRTFNTTAVVGSEKLKLMEFPMAVRRNIPKLLIGHLNYDRMQDYDVELSPRWFYDYAKENIHSISHDISLGHWDRLEGSVTPEALEEIKMNWEQLSDEQRDYIPVRDIDDLYAAFLYDVKFRQPYIKFGDPGEFTVEITMSCRGLHYGHILRNMRSGFRKDYTDYKMKQMPDPNKPGEVKWDYHNSDEFESLKEMEAEIFGNMDNFYICNYRFTRRYGRYIDCYWVVDRINHVKAKEYFSRPLNKLTEHYRFWYDTGR